MYVQRLLVVLTFPNELSATIAPGFNVSILRPGAEQGVKNWKKKGAKSRGVGPAVTERKTLSSSLDVGCS